MFSNISNPFAPLLLKNYFQNFGFRKFHFLHIFYLLFYTIFPKSAFLAEFLKIQLTTLIFFSFKNIDVLKFRKLCGIFEWCCFRVNRLRSSMVREFRGDPHPPRKWIVQVACSPTGSRIPTLETEVLVVWGFKNATCHNKILGGWVG